MVAGRSAIRLRRPSTRVMKGHLPMTVAWKCSVCGYVHEGAEPPLTCPVCGAEADLFTRLDIGVAEPERVWRCTVCGYVHHGAGPPEICPVCGAGAELFEPEPLPGESQVVAGSPRILVVGAGIAGVTAIEAARRAAPDAELRLVSREPGLPYYRLNLTRLLARDIDEAALDMVAPDWAQNRKLDLVHAEAVALDRTARRVLLADGRALEYDRLVVATGARAFLPPLPGADLVGVHTLRTIADARTIAERAERASACVVIGGGLLGLEAAAAIARRGKPVTVLESHPWLLPRQLAERPARLLEAHLAELGVTVRKDVRNIVLSGKGRVERVELGEGEPLAADLVLVATGVRPDAGLGRNAGLSGERGIQVDDRMVTSDPNVLAAGDAAEHLGVVAGIWPVGYAQGSVAGHNAAVGPDSSGVIRYVPEPPATKLKVVAVSVASMGEFLPKYPDDQLVEHEQAGAYLRLVLRGGQLVGANLLGDARLASELETAVERGALRDDLLLLGERYSMLRAALAAQGWVGQ
jgi:nitrite reductase (NADH) large subunit